MDQRFPLGNVPSCGGVVRVTCVVGLKTERGVFIGADSFGSDGWTGQAYKTPKVFRKSGFVFAGFGSYRAIQVLHHNIKLPKRTAKQTPDQFLFTKVIPTMINGFIENGVARKDNESVILGDAGFVFGYDNRLFILQQDFSVLEPYNNFCAGGSGSSHAEASLFSTDGMEEVQRIHKAISCAHNFIVTCDDKVKVIRL